MNKENKAEIDGWVPIPCPAPLPPVDVLMKLIEKECAEYITTGGLRFYGTSWAQLSKIFEDFGYVPKTPF